MRLFHKKSQNNTIDCRECGAVYLKTKMEQLLHIENQSTETFYICNNCVNKLFSLEFHYTGCDQRCEGHYYTNLTRYLPHSWNMCGGIRSYWAFVGRKGNIPIQQKPVTVTVKSASIGSTYKSPKRKKKANK